MAARHQGRGQVLAGALQGAPALLEAFGEDRVGALAGAGLEGGEGDALAQAALRRGQGRQGFVRGVPVAIDAAQLAAAVRPQRSEGAGAVEVDVRIEPLAVEAVDRVGVLEGQELVAHPLAHDGAVLGFDEGVVIAAAGPGPGEFDAQLLQHGGRGVVDVLAAVVGMEAADGAGRRTRRVAGGPRRRGPAAWRMSAGV